MFQPSSYAALPSHFYAREAVMPLPEAHVWGVNAAALRALGQDERGFEEGLMATLRDPAGSRSGMPLATGYAGHQFGQFVPTLGDGRAHLIGDLVDGEGRPWDVQLKGSGRTVYSRGGDGRATLGAVLREYFLGESFHALGIPTTRSLGVILTGERVLRDTAKPGAILIRLASSHVRVGTFQYFACRGDVTALQLLADYAIARHDPDLAGQPDRVRLLLRRVVSRQATLVAQWMAVGFIHGVMNTDNMALSGQTIDFGPCAFMDGFDPHKVFSSIDRQGRYAYDNQPNVALWNLARFAETLLPLLAATTEEAVAIAEEELDRFATVYATAYLDGFKAKLGLAGVAADDASLVEDLLQLMHQASADFMVFFHGLAAVLEGGSTRGLLDAAGVALSAEPGLLHWMSRWQARRAAEDVTDAAAAVRLRSVNPAVVARNHLVEEAIAAAETDGDLEPAGALLAAVAQPFVPPLAEPRYAQAPRPEQLVRQTFCGT